MSASKNNDKKIPWIVVPCAYRIVSEIHNLWSWTWYSNLDRKILHSDWKFSLRCYNSDRCHTINNLDYQLTQLWNRRVVQSSDQFWLLAVPSSQPRIISIVWCSIITGDIDKFGLALHGATWSQHPVLRCKPRLTDDSTVTPSLTQIRKCVHIISLQKIFLVRIFLGQPLVFTSWDVK